MCCMSDEPCLSEEDWPRTERSVLRSRPTTRVGLALALALWTSACYAYHPAQLGPTFSRQREVRVRADRPFPLRAPGAAPNAATLCVTREVRGRMLRVTADTLVLDITSHALEPQSGAEAMPPCPERGPVALVISANERVTSNQLGAARTVLGLLAFGAIAILVMSLLYSAAAPM